MVPCILLGIFTKTKIEMYAARPRMHVCRGELRYLLTATVFYPKYKILSLIFYFWFTTAVRTLPWSLCENQYSYLVGDIAVFVSPGRQRDVCAAEKVLTCRPYDLCV